MIAQIALLHPVAQVAIIVSIAWVSTTAIKGFFGHYDERRIIRRPENKTAN